MRGDGNFVLSGTRYPFQISLAQASVGGASRVHVAIDPGTRAEFIDVDGILSFDEQIPRFDGALTLAGAGESVGKNFSVVPSQRPWRVSANVKADPKGARLEQIDASYGSADSALRLTGKGDIRFGSSPRLRAAFSARQLDADRLFAKEQADPAKMLQTMQRYLTKISKPWLDAGMEMRAVEMLGGGGGFRILSSGGGGVGGWG